MSDVVQYQGTAIATVGEIVSHTLRVQEILKSVMKQDVHYGIIPGTKKNTLYKPGAEILCVTFRIVPTYEVSEDRFDDGVRYRVTCSGVHQGTGAIVATGLGSCSSLEEKYKWCKASKREWEATQIDRRRVQFGYSRSTNTEYEIQQVRVETADIENTLLKMACKRALIAMTLNAVAASDIFAQDIEDLSAKARSIVTDTETGEIGSEAKKEPVKPPQAKSAPKAETKPANGNGQADASGGTAGPTDADATAASNGLVQHVRNRLANAQIDEAVCLKHFDLETLAGITVAQANAILSWSRNSAA
jgi:hypothetical protein